jgi:hypothetical protein
MSVLHLPACPICGSEGDLVRQVLDQAERARTAYTCWECGSVLVWLGDDLWLRRDHWAYQQVGREDKQHLLHKPLATEQLLEMAGQASRLAAGRTRRGPRPEIVEVDGTPVREAAPGEDRATSPPVPSGSAGPRGQRRDAAPAQTPETTALLPVAQVLPEGMALALVRYDGSRVEPVAVFHEGELRAVSARRRRGKGSPLLLIGVGQVLLCLLCSLAVIFVPSLPKLGQALPLASPTAPASTPAPTEAPLPTPNGLPGVTLQGISEYVDAAGHLTVVGEVLNTSASHLRFVEILVGFYDADGKLVGTTSTFAELSTIEVNDSSPFALVVYDLPPTFDTYKLRVDCANTEQPSLRLEILSQEAWLADTGAYHVAGEVRNPNDFAIKFVQVVATYYDPANQVVRVANTLAEAETLQPGRTSTFELILADPPANLSHYRLQTEAVRQ